MTTEYDLTRNVMKKIVAAALFMSGMASAATPIEGWYSTVFGGYAYLPNNLYITRADLLWNNANYKSGFDAGGSFGFKSTPMRYEGEVTYINAQLNRFKIDGFPQVGLKGLNQATFGMANVYYDFPPMISPLEPYLGVGIGYGYISSQFRTKAPLNLTLFDAHNSVFAYQGTAGLTYNFSECYALTVAYRYIATTHMSDFGKIFQANLGNVGVVYRFDGNIYK